MADLKSKLTTPLRVQKKIQETPDACSFVFEIPPEKAQQFLYQPGQFITLFLNVNNEEIHRSYSLCSSPLTDQEFKITVKRVPNGKASNFLIDQVNEGDSLDVTPPAGTFFKMPADLQPKHYLLYAAGSGITPIFSILKSVLTSNSRNRVSLIFANKNEESVIYKKELQDWLDNNSESLKVIHCLSQPPSDWNGHRGRVTEGLVKSSLINAGSMNVEAYLCGPVGFMDLVRTVLTAEGLSPEKIHIESFGLAMDPVDSPPAKEGESSDKIPVDLKGKVLIGDTESPAETPEKIKYLLNGESGEVDYVPGYTILESLIEAGVQAPYSCMDGACMACLGKVKKGLAYQDDLAILTEDNVEMGESLTCQAKPLSRVVEIDYDEL